ncbi:MAG TPA: DUF559 domain-containing protein, partial [Roseiarcus sp.]|nr:DUF559 domain-containing protein [Roseiarcus sp.]
MTSERIEFARQSRKHPTRAEDILWRCLRGSRFDVAKCRRQVLFDRYVVDFYCHAAKLVIELDGKQHEWLSDYDAGRSEVLERLGVHVVRFTNDEVCADLDSHRAMLTATAASGRHVLAIQDTSEINYQAQSGRKQRLGTVGNGSDVGLFIHPVLAVDARDEECLGLVDAQVWRRTKGKAKDYRRLPIEQ